MMHTIACPSCRRTLRVPDDLLGCLVKCPACSHNFPAPSDEPAPEPPRRSSPPAKLEEDDGRLPPRRRPRDDREEEDLRVRPRDEKPGKVQAMAIMMLVGGILALLHGFAWAVSIVGLCWPGTYYSFVFGVMAIVKASQLLSERAYRQVPPQATAIMQIINIVALDVINLTMGIINLVFLSDPEVKRYFRRSPR
jgi:hypothetical protein